MRYYPLVHLFFGAVFLSGTFSSGASSLLVRYPISSTNGINRLDGEAQEHITVSPLSPSKQLGGNDGRGVLGKTSGDYLTSAWPLAGSRNQGKFLEFKITAQNGFEIEYDRLEFTLYSLKDKKTQKNLGPRFWELRASVDVGGVWDSGSGGSIFKGDNGQDSSIQLAFVDMNEHASSTAKIEVVSANALLGTIRTGKTTSFRLYGYAARDGQGGLYNVWNRGSDLLVYGTLHPIDLCETAAWGNAKLAPVISPVPEPHNIGLLFSGVTILLVFVRRRC